MARRRRNRVIYDTARLDAIVSGQRQRTCMDVSRRGYLSKMKVMTEILNGMDDDIREEAFELNEDTTAKMHTGEAAKIYMLKLPINYSEKIKKSLYGKKSTVTEMSCKIKKWRLK